MAGPWGGASLYARGMRRTTGVRGLSADEHRTSKARAAREDVDLSDFLKRESKLSANRPRMSEWLNLTRNLKAIPAARSGAQIVRELRDPR